MTGRPFFILKVLLFTVIAAIPLNADGFMDNFSWSFSGSIFYFAADNGKQGADPAPILPSLGFAASFRILGPVSIELTEDIYFTNYEYNAKIGYPMACNPENRSAFVLGFLTGLQATALLPISNKGFNTRVHAGPAADLRIVTLAIGLDHPADFTGSLEARDPQKETEAIRDYFWSDARWFMFTAGAGMDFPINDRFFLGFDTRIWMPVYRLWTDNDIPAIDGWRFGLGFRITPKKAAKQAPQAEQPNF